MAVTPQLLYEFAPPGGQTWSPTKCAFISEADYIARGITGQPDTLFVSGIGTYPPGVRVLAGDGLGTYEGLWGVAGDEDSSTGGPSLVGQRPEVVTIGPDFRPYVTVQDSGGVAGGRRLRSSDVFDSTYATFADLSEVSPSGPWGTAWLPADGSLWVSGVYQELFHYSPTGDYVATHFYPESGQGLGGMVWVDDLLYIAEAGQGHIVVFDPATSEFSALYTTPEEDPIGRRWEDLAYAAGRLYLCDRNYNDPVTFDQVWIIESIALDGSGYRREFTSDPALSDEDDLVHNAFPLGITGVGNRIWLAGENNQTVLYFDVEDDPGPDPEPPVVVSRNLMSRNAGRGRLGCGVNRAYVTWKCGSPRFCPVLETTEITYGRVLNDISEAEVIVPLSGNADDVCCECLGDIEPWCHELHIERDGEDVWLGPITEIVYEFDKVTIRAVDLLGWLTVRIPELVLNYTDGTGVCPDNPQGEADMTTIGRQILLVAFADDDPCAIDYISALPSGVVGSRCFPPYTDSAFDQLDALAQTGAPEYTVVGRTIILMGPQTPTTPIATLMDEHILGTVMLTKDGGLQANRWFVHYDEDETDEPPGPGYADAPDQYCYGLIERMKEGIGLPSKTDAEDSAQVLLDATPNATMPRLLEIPDGSQLSPLAPWPLSAMIPGVRCDVGITRLCVDATASFRLVGVGVRQDLNGEQVTLSLGTLNPLAGEL